MHLVTHGEYVGNDAVVNVVDSHGTSKGNKTYSYSNILAFFTKLTPNGIQVTRRVNPQPSPCLVVFHGLT